MVLGTGIETAQLSVSTPPLHTVPMQARREVQEQKALLEEEAAAVAARSHSVQERESAATAREADAARRETELRKLEEDAAARDTHAGDLMRQLQEDRTNNARAAEEIAVRPYTPVLRTLSTLRGNPPSGAQAFRAVSRCPRSHTQAQLLAMRLPCVRHHRSKAHQRTSPSVALHIRPSDGVA